jgi:hypothetical protein
LLPAEITPQPTSPPGFHTASAQAVAVFRDICQCLTEGQFGGSAGAVMAQPIFEAGKDRDGTFFARGKADGGIVAPNVC